MPLFQTESITSEMKVMMDHVADIRLTILLSVLDAKIEETEVVSLVKGPDIEL